MPPHVSSTARRVLITATDLFTGSGPAEAAYRRLIEHTPTSEFVYFSRGADLDVADKLPANAHPQRLREDVRPRPFVPGPLPSRTVWRHRQLALAMAASVPGRWFDEVEVPADMPLGDVIRDALALFGTHTRRLTLGVVDTADRLCAQDDVGRVQQAARVAADGIVHRDEPALWPLLRVDAADPQPPDGDSDSTIESTLTVLMPWSGTASGLASALARLRGARSPAVSVLVIERNTPQPDLVAELINAHAPWAVGVSLPGDNETIALQKALKQVATPFAMLLRPGERMHPGWPVQATAILADTSIQAVYGQGGHTPVAGIGPPRRLLSAHGNAPPGIVFRVDAARSAGLYGVFRNDPDRALLLRLSRTGRLAHLPVPSVEPAPRRATDDLDQLREPVLLARHHLAALEAQGRRLPPWAHRRALALAHLAVVASLSPGAAHDEAARHHLRLALALHPLVVLRPPRHLRQNSHHLPRALRLVRNILDRL